MKHLALWLIFGWFFAVESPYGPGISLVQTVGMFRTEAECKHELGKVLDFLESMQVPVRVTKCTYKQET